MSRDSCRVGLGRDSPPALQYASGPQCRTLDEVRASELYVGLRRMNRLPLGWPNVPNSAPNSNVAVQGVRWMLAKTAGAKLVSTGAYVALGWLLTAEEFGTYAFVIGLAVAARALQDRGIREVLISRTLAGLPSIARRALGIGLIINFVAGLTLVATSLGFASTQPPGFRATALLLAISLPIGSPWAIASAKLSMGYEFGRLAKIDLATIIVQYAVAVAFATLGTGAASLSIGLLASALVRGALGTRIVWSELRSSSPQDSAPILKAASWLIVAAAGMGLLDQGDYLVAGFALSAATVGIYYFAYQLPLQLVGLFGSALHSVLLPWLAEVNRTEPERAIRATVRASELLLLGVNAGAVALLLGAPALEALLWRGRWADAVLPIQALCLYVPFRAIIAPIQAMVLGAGKYRRWASMAIALGASALFGAVVATLFWGSALALALCVGTATAAMATWLWVWTIASVGGQGVALVGMFGMLKSYGLFTLGAWFVFILGWAGVVEPGLNALYIGSAFGCLIVTGFLAARFRCEQIKAASKLLTQRRGPLAAAGDS